MLTNRCPANFSKLQSRCPAGFSKSNRPRFLEWNIMDCSSSSSTCGYGRDVGTRRKGKYEVHEWVATRSLTPCTNFALGQHTCAQRLPPLHLIGRRCQLSVDLPVAGMYKCCSHHPIIGCPCHGVMFAESAYQLTKGASPFEGAWTGRGETVSFLCVFFLGGG